MSTFYEQVSNVQIYIQPALFILIVSTNILSIRVLCSRTIRTSPCSYYCIAYSIFSITCISVTCPAQILRAVSIAVENAPIVCNVYYFLTFLSPYLCRAMLVLASFDRYCCSSTSRQLNAKSTIRTTQIVLVTSTILVTAYIGLMGATFYFDTTIGLCRPYTTTAAYIYVISQIMLYYTLAPLLMLIFGVLTISNIRKSIARTGPQAAPMRNRRSEAQLTRMLILQVFSHLILTTPFGVMYCMYALNLSPRTPTISAIRLILFMWNECDYFISFFLHIVSGSIYREQLRKIFKTGEQPTLFTNTLQTHQKQTNQQTRTITINVGQKGGSILN